MCTYQLVGWMERCILEEEEHLTFERLLHIWLEARKGYNSGGDVCKCQIRLKEHLKRDFPKYFTNQGHERSIFSKLLKEYSLFWCSLTLSEREQSHCRLWYLVVARLDRGATDSHQARRKRRRRKFHGRSILRILNSIHWLGGKRTQPATDQRRSRDGGNRDKCFPVWFQHKYIGTPWSTYIRLLPVIPYCKIIHWSLMYHNFLQKCNISCKNFHCCNFDKSLSQDCQYKATIFSTAKRCS